MRENVFKPIAILALNAGDEEHERGILKANGLDAVKAVQGCYKGEKERAWLVVLGQGDRDTVLRLAGCYNQESVLFSGIDRTCELVYRDGKAEIIGVLTEVSQEEAEAAEAYTHDKELGKYWLAKF